MERKKPVIEAFRINAVIDAAKDQAKAVHNGQFNNRTLDTLLDILIYAIVINYRGQDFTMEDLIDDLQKAWDEIGENDIGPVSVQ